MDLIDIIAKDIACVFAGIFIGEHLKTPTQMLIFLPSALLLTLAYYMRWVKARKNLKKALGDRRKTDEHDRSLSVL